MDVLQLSRHLRLFPGQGDLAIASFMEAIRATGFDGWISHEIFNDRFRMASTRRIAADGERSLIAMTGTARGGRSLPAKSALEGTAFIEFAVDEESAEDLAHLFRAMGFAHAGRHRSKDVERFAQGGINLILNMEHEGFAHSHLHHPRAVGGRHRPLGLPTPRAQLARAEALLAPVHRQPVGPGELDIPSIRGVGGALIYFLDHGADLGRVWDVEFAPVEDATDRRRASRGSTISPSRSPSRSCRPGGSIYRTIFDLEPTPQVDVVDPAGLVESQVLQSPDRSVRFTLNASQSRQTQAGRFIDELFGAGVQHVAFACDGHLHRGRADAIGAGVDLLPIPENYYDDLEARFDLDADVAGPAARPRHPLRRGRAGPVFPGLHPGLRRAVLLRGGPARRLRRLRRARTPRSGSPPRPAWRAVPRCRANRRTERGKSKNQREEPVQIVRLDQVSLHVAEAGNPDGPPVVFANSLGTDLRVWDPVLPYLPAGFRYIRYDKRGHGLSDSVPGPWRIEDLADDLAGLLDRLGVRSAAVVGLSVGGLIAQALAARRPDLVRVLVLSDTAPKIGTAEAWNDRIAAVESQGIAAIADAILERWFSPGFRAEEPALALWRNMLTRSPVAGYVATCGAIRDADLTESTRTLRLPTLAMVGDGRRIDPARPRRAPWQR